MHHIPAHTTGVTLFHRDGTVRKFKSLQSALKVLGFHWICENVRENFCVFIGHEHLHTETGPRPNRCYSYANAIMRSDVGTVVTPLDFQQLRPAHAFRYYRKRYWNGEGPVPGTGRIGGRSYFRHLHTSGERRLAQRIDFDEPAPRAARSGRNIPNSWDDYPLTSVYNRNWKRFRKTRWKTSATAK